jgi:hypothetical protein
LHAQNAETTWPTSGKCKLEAATKAQPNSSDAQNATTPLENIPKRPVTSTHADAHFLFILLVVSYISVWIVSSVASQTLGIVTERLMID